MACQLLSALLEANTRILSDLLMMSCLQGGSKVEEAASIFQELGDKFNWTVSQQGNALLAAAHIAAALSHSKCCTC